MPLRGNKWLAKRGLLQEGAAGLFLFQDSLSKSPRVSMNALNDELKPQILSRKCPSPPASEHSRSHESLERI